MKAKNQGRMGDEYRWYVKYSKGVLATYGRDKSHVQRKIKLAKRIKADARKIYPAPPREQELYPLDLNFEANTRMAMGRPESKEEKERAERQRKLDAYRKLMVAEHGEMFLDTVLVLPDAHGKGKPGYRAVLMGAETIVGGEQLHTFINLHFGKGWNAKKIDDRHWAVMKTREKIHERQKPEEVTQAV